MGALLSSGITGFTLLFSLQAPFTVIPKKGARLIKCDLISAHIFPFAILSLIFQNIVSSHRGFFHCEIQGDVLLFFVVMVLVKERFLYCI